MTDVEALMREQIASDRDCSANALCLLGLRGDMKRLVADWRAAGGSDLLPNIRDRRGLRIVKPEIKPAHARR